MVEHESAGLRPPRHSFLWERAEHSEGDFLFLRQLRPPLTQWLAGSSPILLPVMWGVFQNLWLIYSPILMAQSMSAWQHRVVTPLSKCATWGDTSSFILRWLLL